MSSITHQAACGVQATYRWCLTGTPIQNRLADYGSLLKYLQVPPFTMPRVFDYWITSAFTKTPSEGLRRLRRLVGATCLRRTKVSLGAVLQLPGRIDREEYCDLSSEDRALYDFFRLRAASIVSGLLSTDDSSRAAQPRANIVTLINYLRSICNHGEQLLPDAAVKIYRSSSTRTGSDAIAVPGYNLGSSLLSPDDNNETGCCRPSAKVARLLYQIGEEQRQNNTDAEAPPVKSVIFSCSTKMLDLIEVRLRDRYCYRRVDGRSSLKDRGKALEAFARDRECTIFLASITAVGEGVDLTAATRVHLMEPHWNPMREAQALDRVHRMGQTRDVVTIRYVVTNSIEDYVRNIQKRKLRIIDQSLNGTGLEQEGARLQELLDTLDVNLTTK